MDFDLLPRVTLKGLKAHKTSNGVAWAATVCLDGKRLMRVENEGNGGGSRFSPLAGGNHRDVWDFVKQANEEAAEAIGAADVSGCFENLLSSMDPGMTALDAVPTWKRAVAFLAEVA